MKYRVPLGRKKNLGRASGIDARPRFISIKRGSESNLLRRMLLQVGDRLLEREDGV